MAKRLLARVSGLILFGLVACGVKAPNYDYAKEPNPNQMEFVLGVGDVVSVNVYEHNEVTSEATIRPDGTITLPLVGDLKAAGATPSALKQQIAKHLADFIKVQDPAITVAVKSWRSYRFSLAGEIQRPSVYTSENYVTVAEAIAMAGGFTRFSRRNSIVLMRRDSVTGKVHNIPLAYDLLASGRRPDMNIYIMPGDSIYVP